VNGAIKEGSKGAEKALDDLSNEFANNSDDISKGFDELKETMDEAKPLFDEISADAAEHIDAINDAAGAVVADVASSESGQNFTSELEAAAECAEDWAQAISGENEPENEDYEEWEKFEDVVEEDWEEWEEDFETDFNVTDETFEDFDDFEDAFDDEFAKLDDAAVTTDAITMVSMDATPVAPVVENQYSSVYNTMGLLILAAASLAGSFFVLKKVKKTVFRSVDDDNMYNKISA